MKKNIFIASAVIFIAVSFIAASFLYSIDSVPVLMYHSIDPDHKGSSLSVSPEAFKRQMEFLHKHRYNVVRLDKVVSYIEKKEKMPPRTVAITLDDGAYNNYSEAYPVLKKLSIPATFFIIVDLVGSPGRVDWKDLQEMSASGVIDIGSHSKSHPWLTSLGKKDLWEEVAGSKKILEERLGSKVDAFCYPGGSFDKRSEAAAKEAGYILAVATNPSKGNSRNDVYAIKRVKISGSADNLFVFWAETTPLYTWIKDRRND